MAWIATGRDSPLLHQLLQGGGHRRRPRLGQLVLNDRVDCYKSIDLIVPRCGETVKWQQMSGNEADLHVPHRGTRSITASWLGTVTRTRRLSAVT